MTKPVPTVNAVNREYFEGTSIGELRVRHCTRCGARFRFLSQWCPQCWSLDLDWERTSGCATVTHYTVVHQPPIEAFETPYVLALVDLDEGVRMMTNIVNCAPQEVSIGMRVRVTFQARDDIMLPMFEPVPGG